MNATSSGVYLGRLFGIRFYLDYSWFIIAGILTYILSSQLFPQSLPGQSGATYLTMGIVASGLFFLSILLHELGHSLVSQRCGIPVPKITLLFIGGIAEISREPDNPKHELKIAIAGPLVTVVLIGIFEAIARVSSMLGVQEPWLIFHWLALVNFTLVVFNAIPGYPLDGGRVLRALIWAQSGNMRKATFLTSRIGVFFSWMLIALGIFLLFNGLWNAVVFIFIGIFLKSAAEGGYLQAIYHEVLSGVRVRDIMSASPVWIPAHLPVNLAVDDYFLTNHHVAFPVCDSEGIFEGLLHLEHLKRLPREKWPFTTAGELVSHNTDGLTISVTDSARKAMHRLLATGPGRLAVLSGDKLVGIVTRHDILHFIQIHTELEA
jgi:Zn-dependent protease/CBS domain-containing protein